MLGRGGSSFLTLDASRHVKQFFACQPIFVSDNNPAAGVRILKGAAVASLSVGTGASVEVLVRPVGGTSDEIAALAGERDVTEVAKVLLNPERCYLTARMNISEFNFR